MQACASPPGNEVSEVFLDQGKRRVDGCHLVGKVEVWLSCSLRSVREAES
jgi:hypothetical protein